ncbi:MAG: AbrB/MazE/SpoVT family DNA-binding domain-containing protein [Desulfurococcales archaeon]|nr:AbrB/MazE/SpoVT family DNA-binding domain-containing protein [Desulfurococcales archaeon]
MGLVVCVDSKGRIVLPKEVREKCGIKPGSKVLVDVVGRGEILVKVIETDPSMELAELLGEFKLTRRDRVEAERLLWREVG